MIMLSFVLLCLLSSPALALEWHDWDQLKICHPTAIYNNFTTEADISSFLKSSSYDQVKTVGAGHSFSSIALTDDDVNFKTALISLDNYAGIISITPSGTDSFDVKVKAGTRLRDLNTLLEQNDLSLVNLGATAAQSIAGAISTSTHGTGAKIGSISSAVTALTVIDADGNIIDSENNPDLLKFGRVSLGCLGVISTVTITAVPLFKMKLSVFSLPLDQVLANHDYYLSTYDRFQFSFVPYTNVATVMIRELVPVDTPTTDCWATPAPTYPCVDVSYKTLVDSLERYDNRTLYTEMEMFVPVEDALAAINDFVEYQNSIEELHDDDICSLYTNIRYVGADDIPTSMMYKRDIAVISFICLGSKEKTGSEVEFKRYASGLENITSSKYEGVPHWGKENWAEREDLGKVYDLDAFNNFRKTIDPNGIFMNEYLRARLQ